LSARTPTAGSRAGRSRSSVEATLPDSRGQVLDQLADDLGLSRSQVIDEAVGLFLKAVIEAQRGHRLVTLAGDEPACELSTPTPAAMEWTARRQPLVLSDPAVGRIAGLLDNPPAPGARLAQAFRRKR
jgi:uncharacterized protein (DUF1778 family)